MIRFDSKRQKEKFVRAAKARGLSLNSYALTALETYYELKEIENRLSQSRENLDQGEPQK